MKLQVENPKSFETLTSEFQKYIDDNKTGGILCAVYQKGNLVYCNKFGWKDKENKIPIAFDDIFRIYSLTKTIKCLAALILLEQQKFDLDDSLEKFLPEFNNLKVLKSYNEQTGKIEFVDVKKSITIKQLFTHTSGLSYGDYHLLPDENLYGKAFGFTGETRLRTKLDMIPIMPPLKEFSRRLATLPLAFEPGTYWWYGFNHELMGYLIEVISGKKLDVFLKEHIFDKLGMNDTDFYVPEEKWNRLAKVYTKNQDDKLVIAKRSLMKSSSLKTPSCLVGGGLVSTLEDYLKVCLMMLNGGEYNGNQIVSKETIKLMTNNQLPNNRSFLDMQYFPYRDLKSIKSRKGYGYGLGVLVKTAKNMSREEIGGYSWAGTLNTQFNIDPLNQVISIVLTQYCSKSSDWIFPIDSYRITDLVYESLEKLNK